MGSFPSYCIYLVIYFFIMRWCLQCMYIIFLNRYMLKYILYSDKMFIKRDHSTGYSISWPKRM